MSISQTASPLIVILKASVLLQALVTVLSLAVQAATLVPVKA
jgi:hypothetical protein